MTDDILSDILLFSAISTLFGCSIFVVYKFACAENESEEDLVPTRVVICVDSQPAADDAHSPLTANLQPIEVVTTRENTIAVPEEHIIAKVEIIHST